MPVKNKAGPGEGAALLLVDVQEGLKEASWGKQSNLDAEQTIARLLAGWRTVRMAGNLDFRVWLVADGTATFERTAPDGSRLSAEDMHRAHLASLDGEFCQVVNADTALELAEPPPRDAVEASQ